MTPDLRNVRVLIPPTRRAIDGPTATGSGSVSASLTDDEVKNLDADAIADVILLTGSLFGHTLEVAARDDSYGAPTEWRTDTELSPDESRAIVAQAGLTYFFFKARLIKVHETIQDEGQSWDYDLSANFVRDQMAYLIGMRDKAIEAIIRVHPPADAWVDFVHERDQFAAAFLEPFGSQHNQGMGGQFMDPRGFY